MTRYVLASIVTMMACLHCGGSDGASTGKSGPGGVEGAHGSCASAADCAGGETCIAAPGEGGACVPTCSVNGTDCSGTASCGQVATLSVNVCKKAETASDAGAASSGSEEIYVPCQSDAECQAVGEGTVCATDSRGVRECTVRCSQESDCDTPSFAGIGVDFFTCAKDASDASRTVCLFDPKCESDPLSCTTGFGIPPIGTGPGGDPADPPTDPSMPPLPMP